MNSTVGVCAVWYVERNSSILSVMICLILVKGLLRQLSVLALQLIVCVKLSIAFSVTVLCSDIEMECSWFEDE